MTGGGDARHSGREHEDHFRDGRRELRIGGDVFRGRLGRQGGGHEENTDQDEGLRFDVEGHLALEVSRLPGFLPLAPGEVVQKGKAKGKDQEQDLGDHKAPVAGAKKPRPAGHIGDGEREPCHQKAKDSSDAECAETDDGPWPEPTRFLIAGAEAPERQKLGDATEPDGGGDL